MFGKVLGAGAQALVVEVREASAFLDAKAGQQLLDIHRQQVHSRGLVAKILRSLPWPQWFIDNDVIPSHPSLMQQLVLLDKPAIAKAGQLAAKIASLQSNFVVPYIRVATLPYECRILMPRYSMTLQQWGQANFEKLSERNILKIASQLTLGLIDLHENGVYHMDFTGSNVFVANSSSLEPHCVIADLEASFYVGLSDEVPPNFTEMFAAPERGSVRLPRPRGDLSNFQSAASAGEAWTAMVDDVLGKCDVWSLGMVLYSMAANHDFPGLAEDTPELGTILLNHRQLTPTRIAAIVRRDLTVFPKQKMKAAFSEGFVSLLTMMLNHDPATRPSLYAVLESITSMLEDNPLTRERGLPFPLSLNAFDLIRVSSTVITSQVEIFTESQMYDAHVVCVKCGTVRSTNRRQRTDCSANGGMAHLPSHTSFCWRTREHLPLMVNDGMKQSMVFLFPMVCDSVQSERLLTELDLMLQRDEPNSDTLLVTMLQLQGGFAVIGESSSSSSCTPSEIFIPVPRKFGRRSNGKSFPELHFAAAQPWPSACNAVLAQSGRIHTEVPSLLGTTAKCFSWILPGESFMLPNGEMWVPAPDGGMVFWFEENAARPHELDRYFPVCHSLPAPSSIPLLEATKKLFGLPNAGGDTSQFQSSMPQTGFGESNCIIASQDRREFRTPSCVGGGAALTDRTPAGRLLMHELDDEATPDVGGVQAPHFYSVVDSSPIVLAKLTERNLPPRHPQSTSQAQQLQAEARVSHSNPATRPASEVGESQPSSRASSRPSTNAQTAVVSQQASLRGSRETTLESADSRQAPSSLPFVATRANSLGSDVSVLHGNLHTPFQGSDVSTDAAPSPHITADRRGRMMPVDRYSSSRSPDPSGCALQSARQPVVTAPKRRNSGRGGFQPILYASIMWSPSLVTVNDFGGGDQRRFRIVSSGEYGSCGPIVPVAAVPQLAGALGISRNAAEFVCFCVTDAPPKSVQNDASIAPGGAFAASTYHGSEKYLQHHGFILFDSALRPNGIIPLRITESVDPMENRDGIGFTRLQVELRAPLRNTKLVGVPVGDYVEYDTFLAAPPSLLTVGSTAVCGGIASYQRPSTTSSAQSSLPSTRLSSAVTSLMAMSCPQSVDGSNSAEGGAEGCEWEIVQQNGFSAVAFDVQSSCFHFSDALKRDWVVLHLL